MMLALLLLLVAMMVSITLFSAAVTGYKTIGSDHAQQQGILTLRSAAEYLRDCFETAVPYQLVTVTRTYYNPSSVQSSTAGIHAEGELHELIDAALSHPYETGPFSQSYTLEASGFDPVSLDLKVSRTQSNGQYIYHLCATFLGTFGGQERKMILTMEGKNAQAPTIESAWSTEENCQIEKKTVKITWGEAKIQRKEQTQ